MNDLKNILNRRKEIYGDYLGGTKVRVDILNIIRRRYLDINGKEMSDIHKMFFIDIINKISRLSASPEHIDSWTDIAGYSQRIIEAINEEREERKKSIIEPPNVT